MKKYFYILFILVVLISCKNKDNHNVKINWVDNLEGDFSFINEWEYADYVYQDDFGQLVCDGICPSEVDNMRDINGKILDDSLSRYYQYVDTTHLHYTIESESNTYEWAGTNQIIAYYGNTDTIKSYTLCSPSTHSSLEINFIENKCYPQIKLNSITNRGTEYFTCKGGYIKIDKQEFEKGILKAEFNFDFIRPDNDEIPMFWKGKIHTVITKN